MKGLLWLTGAALALTACGKSGGSGSGLGEGDVFPTQYQNRNYVCTGTSTNGQSQGRQYTLTASISSQPLDLNSNNGDRRRMQASLINQQTQSVNSSYNYTGGTNFNGVGQSEPSEARYFNNEGVIILTPTNRNGTSSSWSGEFRVWANSSRGRFNGRIAGQAITMDNMNCNQTVGGFGSTNQFGQGINGVGGTIPTYLTCRDTRGSTATIQNGRMTISGTGRQETFSLITRGQNFQGSTSQTYDVQSSGRSGTVTISRSVTGGTLNYGTNGAFGGQYTARFSNVYYQGQLLNTMSCN